MLTKSLIRPATNIIRPIDSTTAAIMTGSSSTMPTAVMTESSEKTRSTRMIWTMIAANVADFPLPPPWSSSPSSLAWISVTAL